MPATFSTWAPGGHEKLSDGVVVWDVHETALLCVIYSGKLCLEGVPMKRLAVFTILMSASVMFAQHAPLINTGPLMHPPANAFPFGNILFPGGIPQHPQNLGTSVSGILPHNYGFRPNNRGGASEGHVRTVVIPYAVPFYDPYYAPQQQPPNVTVVVPQQPTPSVVINQNFTPDTAKPLMRDYSENDLPESNAPNSSVRVYEAPMRSGGTNNQPRSATPRAPVDDKATIYLIALKDSTIHSAIGYWVEDGTLHYVTPQGTANRVTLDRVDKELTDQLNRERHVDFTLNKTQQ
jgi:hypothetical protein